MGGVASYVKVEIWSDVACPWCYVGTQRFGRAIQETGVDVEVVYRSFELDPTVPTGGDSPLLVDYLAQKFGDRSRVQAAHARLTDAGAELGIDFRWSGCAGPTRSTPTGCSPGRCTSTGRTSSER